MILFDFLLLHLQKPPPSAKSVCGLLWLHTAQDISGLLCVSLEGKDAKNMGLRMVIPVLSQEFRKWGTPLTLCFTLLSWGFSLSLSSSW